MNPKYLYKIFTVCEWNSRKDKDNILGTDKDLKDKFIHLSTSRQVDTIVKKIFSTESLDVSKCILLKIDFEKLSNLGKFSLDKASNGEYYYHLYLDSFTKECIVESDYYSKIKVE